MRAELRSLALSNRAAPKKIVEFEGQKFEIRKPTYRDRADILRLSKVTSGDAEKIDLALLQAQALVRCAFHPESGERVFDDADVDVILAKPAGELDILTDAAVEMLSVDKGALGK